MSMVLELELSSNKVKPVFTTVTKSNKKITCLFDTGATMPVWCKSEGLFKVLFPQAKLITGQYILSGFGKGAEIVNVYEIPEFYISNGSSKIVFKNLLLATSFDRDFGCDLILSYTMFNLIDYSVLNRNRDYPALRLEFDRENYYVIPVKYSNDMLKRIAVFTGDGSTKNLAAGFRSLYENKNNSDD